jgi:HEAT repeats
LAAIPCGDEGMTGFVQLDLFGERPDLNRPVSGPLAAPISPEDLSDGNLIAAIPNATLSNAIAITAEVARRQLAGAVPALISLCNQFVGYGASVVVPEQIAALNALGAIGGQDAAQAVARLITKETVQGPTLVTALDVATQLGVVLPNDVAVRLLRDPHSSVRAATCDCVRTGHEIIAILVSMLGDPDGEIIISAACALGRMGRNEALRPLKRYLTERPSRRIVEALARVADEEAIVLLARTGRARRELTAAVVTSLEAIEHPRAMTSADALRRSLTQSGCREELEHLPRGEVERKMKPGPNDEKLAIIIAGDELRELKRFTVDMAEAYGLDRRIETYSGKRPIGLYRWDADCLLAVIDNVLRDKREYPDVGSTSYAALKRLHSRLSEDYRRVWERRVVVVTSDPNTHHMRKTTQ